MKRTTALLLIGFLLCLAACTGGPSPTDQGGPSPTGNSATPTPAQTQGFIQQEVRTVRMPTVFNTMTASRAGEIEDEINRLLREEALVPLRLEFVQVPPLREGGEAFPSIDNFSQAWIHDINNHERFDIFPGYRIRVEDYPQLIEEGVVMDIGEHLRFFPDLMEMSAEEAWEEATIGDGIWWFPLASTPSGGYEWSGYTWIPHYLSVEQTLLDAINADYPHTLEEMTAILRELQARGLPHKLICSPYVPPLALHRTYEEWPFYVSQDSLFIYYADGSMEPYIESDIFLKDVAILKELDEEGLVLWNDARYDGLLENTLDSGAAIGMDGKLTSSDTVRHGLLEPDKPGARVYSFATGGIFLSPLCKDPQAALEMIQAIYSHDKIALTLTYGVEGKDWVIQEDGTFKLLSTSISGTFGRSVFYRYQNMLPYMKQDVLAKLDAFQGQSYPFSGFLHEYTAQNYVVSNPSPEDVALQEASYGIAALRRGDIPMIELETVRRNLYDNGFKAVFEETQSRYERFKER